MAGSTLIRWTKEEDDMLRAKKDVHSSQLISLFNRTARAIQSRKTILGLSAESHYWDAEEVEYLKANRDAPDAELAKHLGRSAKSVRYKKTALFGNVNKGLSDEQVKFIYQNADKPIYEIAKILGVSNTLVSNGMRNMGLSSVKSIWQTDNDNGKREFIVKLFRSKGINDKNYNEFIVKTRRAVANAMEAVNEQ